MEELTFDGGHQVFMECAPVWDGEDDLFDVRRLDDLDLLPDLKLFTGGLALKPRVPGAVEILAARGITARCRRNTPHPPMPRAGSPRPWRRRAPLPMTVRRSGAAGYNPGPL
ncbi:hypothetical protein [Streptomyces sp. NPDC006551]|uniref:DUF6892 domain-containing protein n=1 Tax=Streptomyces sp. NPDC006551 TaxID=3157178 RepID=UPI0033A902DE